MRSFHIALCVLSLVLGGAVCKAAPGSVRPTTRADTFSQTAVAKAKAVRSIAALTGGRVRYGWPQGRVERILGTPIRIDDWQMAGGETAVYDRFTLGFDDGRLVCAYPIPIGQVYPF